MVEKSGRFSMGWFRFSTLHLGLTIPRYGDLPVGVCVSSGGGGIGSVTLHGATTHDDASVVPRADVCVCVCGGGGGSLEHHCIPSTNAPAHCGTVCSPAPNLGPGGVPSDDPDAPPPDGLVRRRLRRPGAGPSRIVIGVAQDPNPRGGGPPLRYWLN